MNRDCHKVHELLIPYINRQLSSEENSYIILYMAQCPECRKEAAELILLKKQMIDILVEVPQEMYSAAFKKVKDTIQDHSKVNMEPQNIINTSDSATKTVCSAIEAFNNRIIGTVDNANKLTNSTTDIVNEINNCKSPYIIFNVMNYVVLLTKNTISLSLQII